MTTLMTLLKEVRLMIYGYLMRPSCLTIASAYQGDPNVPLIDRDHNGLPQFFVQTTADVSVNLLRACKELRRETEALTLQPHRLVLQPTKFHDGHDMEADGWAPVQMNRLPAMPDVHTLELEIRLFKTTWKQDLEHNRVLKRNLSLPDRVQKLEVTVTTNLLDLSDEELVRVISLWRGKLIASRISLTIVMSSFERGEFELVRILGKDKEICDWQIDDDGQRDLHLSSLAALRALERAMVEAFIGEHIDLLGHAGL